MQIITRESVNALIYGHKLHKGNMAVENNIMYLHGNCIARYYPLEDRIYLSDAGWQTRTTKDRLNGILDHLGLEPIYQKDFVWYRGANEWTGSETIIKG